MNRIFKVIWNNVLQRKVVTSELGKSQSNSHSLETVKGSPILTSRPNRLWQALLLSSLLGISTVATAEPIFFVLPEGCTLDGSELTCSGKSLLFTGSGEENKDINSIMIDGKASQVTMNKGDYQNASMKIDKKASGGKKTTLTIDLEEDSYINEIIDISGQYNGLYNIEGSGERFDRIIVVSKSNSADGPKFNYAGGTAVKPLYTGSLNVTGATLNIESGYVQFRPEDQWISPASMAMNVKDEASIKLVTENNIPSCGVDSTLKTKSNADITKGC